MKHTLVTVRWIAAPPTTASAEGSSTVIVVIINLPYFLAFTINPDKFDKLIITLRTAVDNDGTLDKEATSYNDIFDACRLSLKFYRYEDSSNDWPYERASASMSSLIQS